ncbi:MAG: RND transporter [Ponticaulis sp.]|nr:RND transporter [Ponticaulis sp.]|tara:strand:+ start:401 stop:3547 length:3147 start_codon:yes stop_codon:yes gene_type:complete
MRGIVKWWASNPVAANLLMIAIVIGGIIAFFNLDREIDPYVEIPGAQISVVWLGASPQDVEEQLVTRLEEAVSRVEGVDELRSFASESQAVVVVQGKMSLDKDAFLQEIKREIDSISTFPSAAEPPQIRLFSSQNEIMRIAVTGDESVTEKQLKRHAEKVRREISLLPTVPEVELFGVRNEEISIEVSEETLRRYSLTLNEVAAAVRATSLNSSAGAVRSDGGTIQLSTRAQADTQEEFENIVVKQLPTGAVIRIGEIADVIDGFEQVDLLATVNGERAILVQVMSGPNMNVVQMSADIRDYMERHADNMPEGMSMTLWNDASVVFQGNIDTIAKNFFTGLILVMITLLLFLRPTVALWVCGGIAVAFMGGMIFLPAMGVSINMISTFAFLLVIGVIVDDAIIVGEAIHNQTEEGKQGIKAAVLGTKSVIKPVIFAVLTTMIFFAPWMFLSGPTKEFTRSISIVVIMALVFSLVESLLILPAHLAHLKPANPKNIFTRFQTSLADSLVWFARNVYRPVLVLALRRRFSTALMFFCVTILTFGLVTNNLVRTEFFPQGEADQIAITVELPQGTPYARTLQVLEQIQVAEKTLEEEINTSTNGEGELIENWYTRSRDNNVLALVKLVPPETRTLTAKQTAERLRELIGEVPDAETIEVNYTNNFNGAPIQYVLNSSDLDALNDAANDLMSRLRSFEGVYNVINDSQSASEEIQFDLKPGAEALGITYQDVNRQVRQGFFGEEVQRLPRDGEDVRVYVRYPRNDREDLDFLNNIRIRTADGREVPLNAVADLRFEQGITQINRRERQRAVVISAEVAEERISEIRQELNDNYFEGFEARHPDVKRGNFGRADDEAQTMMEIFLLLGIAICVAYFLVAVAFRSYVEPMLILFAAVPFCATGGILGHAIGGHSLSVFSFLGIVAAAGVAVNDNLVLIDYVHKLRAKGMSGVDALVEAGTRRFRPILLTSLTTYVGLLPLMSERSIQAQWLVPIGVGLAYGVLFALFVTLFLVPALYGLGADVKRFFLYIASGKKRMNFHDELGEAGRPIVPAE